MSRGKQHFIWFCYCLGVYTTNRDEILHHSQRARNLVKTLKKAVQVAETFYDGDAGKMLIALEQELGDTIKDCDEIKLLDRIYLSLSSH